MAPDGSGFDSYVALNKLFQLRSVVKLFEKTGLVVFHLKYSTVM